MVIVQSELDVRERDVRGKAGRLGGVVQCGLKGLGNKGGFGENIELVQVLYWDCDDVRTPS